MTLPNQLEDLLTGYDTVIDQNGNTLEPRGTLRMGSGMTASDVGGETVLSADSGALVPPAGAGAVVYSGGAVGFAEGSDGDVLSYVGGVPLWAPPVVQPPETLDPAGGLSRGANGLGVALLSSGGLYTDANGLLRCRVGNGMNVGGAGLTLRLPASGSRLAYDGSGNVVVSGRTLVDSGASYNEAGESITATSDRIWGNSTPITVKSGDVIEASLISRVLNFSGRLRIAEGPLISSTELLSRPVTTAGASLTFGGFSQLRYVAAADGTVHLQVAGMQSSSSGTTQVRETNVVWRVFR